jgi:hypothetical protein
VRHLTTVNTKGVRVNFCGNLFTELLPSNERLLWLRYSGFQASCHSTSSFISATLVTQFLSNSKESLKADSLPSGQELKPEDSLQPQRKYDNFDMNRTGASLKRN